MSFLRNEQVENFHVQTDIDSFYVSVEALLYKSSISCRLSYYRYSSDFSVFTRAIAHHDPSFSPFLLMHRVPQ